MRYNASEAFLVLSLRLHSYILSQRLCDRLPVVPNQSGIDPTCNFLFIGNFTAGVFLPVNTGLKWWYCSHTRNSLDNPNTTLPEICRYDACIVISKDHQHDGSISEGKISGGTYVIYKIKHTAEDIQQTWTEIFPFIQNSGYQMADKPILERYTGDMIYNDYCELCVPVIPS